MKDKLLSHLHEQYAVNNNANLSGIITIIISTIVVLGGYGYVYLHTGCDFSDCFKYLVAENGCFYLDALLLAQFAVHLILCFLIALCAYQGIAQRKEQFITYAIRAKYWKNDPGYKELLPNNYHPYNKKRKNVVQGMYGELIKIFMILQIMVIILTSLKLLSNINLNVDCYGLGMVEFFLMLIFIIIMSCCTCRYFENQYDSYKDRQHEYETKGYTIL